MKEFFTSLRPFSDRNKGRLYADAAASTPLHPRAARRLAKLLALYGNPGSLHAEGVAAERELEAARKEVAAALGAHTDEIVFTSGGTEANNLALAGALMPLVRDECASGRPALRAVTTAIEHPSVLGPLRNLAKRGLDLVELPVDEGGLVSPRALADALTEETVLVSVQLVNSEVGTVEPVRELAKEIRHIRKKRTEEGNALPLYFHTDAAQAPLYLPLAVEKLGVDLMTLDAQKILGPKGVGALYRRRGVKLEPVLYGGEQEQGMRPGTANAPLSGAFAEALALAQTGVEERAKRVAAVRDFLIETIAKRVPGAELNGSREHRIANNVNISIPGLEGETAVIALDAFGVAASTRSACELGGEEPSYVVQALGHSKERARGAIRITLLPDATKRDARRIADALLGAYKLYRKP